MATEWGRINDGAPFHVITVDLDRAMAHLRINQYEHMLLQYVREHSWGVAVRQKRKGEPWPDPLVVLLNVSALAREWGVTRQRLDEAKTSLIVRHVLNDEGEGRVTINKDATIWNGLSPASLAYCKQASSMRRTPQRATDKQSSCTPQRAETAEGCTPQRAGGARHSVQSHIEERPRVPEDSGRDPEEGGGAPAPDPVKAPEPTDPEVERVAKLMDRLDPYANGGWAQKAYQFAAMYPPAWILAAGEAAAAAGKGDWRYVHRILQRYQQQGGPDAAPPPRPVAAEAPAPPKPPRCEPEPEMTPEERRAYGRRFREIALGAAHAN